MCSDSIFNFLKTVSDGSCLFSCKTLVFLLIHLLNLGAQIRCPQNRFNNLKSVVDQTLKINKVLCAIPFLLKKGLKITFPKMPGKLFKVLGLLRNVSAVP